MERSRDARPLPHVGERDCAGEPSAATPAADGRDSDDCSGLEVIRRRVTSRAGQLDERLDRRWNDDYFGSGRPAASHRDDDDLVLRREQPSEMAGDGGLADTLPGSGDRDRRHGERRALGWVEAEVCPHVGHAAGEHPADERQTRWRPEHGLVGEVDHDVGCMACDGRLHVLDERDAVVLTAAELLLPANEDGGGEVVRELRERVTYDVGVVLAVDDRDGSHVRAVTSSSIAPVNFAYSRVSRLKETRRSWPWNGWRRQTSTFLSAISMML